MAPAVIEYLAVTAAWVNEKNLAFEQLEKMFGCRVAAASLTAIKTPSILGPILQRPLKNRASSRRNNSEIFGQVGHQNCVILRENNAPILPLRR